MLWHEHTPSLGGGGEDGRACAWSLWEDTGLMGADRELVWEYSSALLCTSLPPDLGAFLPSFVLFICTCFSCSTVDERTEQMSWWILAYYYTKIKFMLYRMSKQQCRNKFITVSIKMNSDLCTMLLDSKVFTPNREIPYNAHNCKWHDNIQPIRKEYTSMSSSSALLLLTLQFAQRHDT